MSVRHTRWLDILFEILTKHIGSKIVKDLLAYVVTKFCKAFFE